MVRILHCRNTGTSPVTHPPDQLTDSRLPGAGAAAASAEWALFTEWCAVTGHAPLPATPETVLMFFGDCPAAPATFGRRLTAIDAAHRAAGVTPPERTGQVRDVLRGRSHAKPRTRLTSTLRDSSGRSYFPMKGRGLSRCGAAGFAAHVR